MIKLSNDFYYRVQAGDDERTIINKFNTSKDSIIRNDNNIDFYIGEWIRIKVNDYLTHIVRPMETIAKIASRYNVSVEKLVADNHLKADKLFIGQRLKIYNH